MAADRLPGVRFDIFIIDPAYTLPLLIGMIATAAAGHTRNWLRAVNTAGLVLSSAYLGWTLVTRLHVEDAPRRALDRQDIHYSRFLTTPAPFNAVRWRLIVIDGSGYYESWYSLLDRNDDISFVHCPSIRGLLSSVENERAVQSLEWFTHGFYSVTQLASDVISDLRIGRELDYVFRFRVGKNPHARAAEADKPPTVRNMERPRRIMRRTWTESQ